MSDPVVNAQLLEYELKDQWGPWRFDTPRLCLVHEQISYEIDLERINSCAEMLDWIFQIQGKVEIYEAAEVPAAFADIFKPQANCCSFGIEKEFSGSSLAKKYAKELADAGFKSWTLPL